ncbi:uncharacterized protein LOC122638793 [Telopea speciosissima]|uniref:uncharacterized protein LOC122638793 n=1 Tax=Telopea speciosissima TaxID=54955 RepID=UPI001CC6559F|nr:uncharacterized protein LOC122638793 [Telopea speciosissima]
MVKPVHELSKSKYYRFHQDYGHGTEDCRQLKDEIEALIQRGRLSHFVKKDGSERRQEYRPWETEEKAKSPAWLDREDRARGKRHIENASLREIATIYRGPGLGGESSNSRKNHAQCSPHDDALVIKMTIANCTVAKVLADNGSLVDILYYDAFEKMHLKPEMLKRVESPLYGFNGALVHIEGSIELLVMVGMERKLSVMMMNFLVVKANSTHNGILGRPGLNTLYVVVSTPHLVMKFPTDQGIEECRGSQITTQKCYEGYLRAKGKEPQTLLINLEDDRDNSEHERTEL